MELYEDTWLIFYFEWLSKANHMANVWLLGSTIIIFAINYLASPQHASFFIT